MIKKCLLFCLVVSSFSFAKSITGTVKLAPNVERVREKGESLFIFARREGQKKGPPVAAIKIASPKFPQSFTLSAKNVMIPGSQFIGEMTVVARYSPSGSALNKVGAYEGWVTGLRPGAKDIKILIDKRAK